MDKHVKAIAQVPVKGVVNWTVGAVVVVGVPVRVQIHAQALLMLCIIVRNVIACAQIHVKQDVKNHAKMVVKRGVALLVRGHVMQYVKTHVIAIVKAPVIHLVIAHVKLAVKVPAKVAVQVVLVPVKELVALIAFPAQVTVWEHV